ncbi:glutamate ABC transporter substrate-binding protein [Actinophytocola sp.]|uniref:glutamate ABC transporter substrate-binding protein n=1 Tax=Actinophytocola sp. TaxID=1872138 RepID=UPI00389AF953
MKAVTLVLAVVLVAAGCSAAPAPVDTHDPTVVEPLPAGATEVTATAAASADESCQPTRSYRPDGPPPAPGQFPAGSMMAAIHQRGRLIVGVDQNTYRFAYRDSKTGQIEGFALDIAHQLAKAILGDENKIQLVVLTSAQRIPAVQHGDVDLVVHSMTANCDRWRKVDFSTIFYLAHQRVLVRDDAKYTGTDWLAGKKVCGTEQSTSLARIVNLDVDPKPIGMQVAGWTDCLVMLQQHQVDAISTDDTILAGLAAQDPSIMVAPGSLADEPYGIAIPKNHKEFVQFVNSVLEQIKADGRWTAYYDKWLQPLLQEPAAPPVAEFRD